MFLRLYDVEEVYLGSALLANPEPEVVGIDAPAEIGK